jgi:hypothetical protein
MYRTVITQACLPWPHWAMKHKIESTLFVSFCPGKPWQAGVTNFLAISFLFLPINFANVKEPLTIFSLAKCPCYNATISYGGYSFYFLLVPTVPEAVFLVMFDPSMNEL